MTRDREAAGSSTRDGTLKRNREDFAFLTANGRVGLALNLPSFMHLDQPIGLWNYIRIANDIARRLGGGRLLDWGCGYGQMTYLLARRGFEVVPFDVVPLDFALPDVPLTRAIPPLVRTTEPVTMPFESGSFDAVLSCGVLEHVDELSASGNEERSLREIARVLKPGGALLIYQLPQQHAWQEAMIRRFRLGYSHPRRYTAAGIARELSAAGYRVQSLSRMNLIPKNLTGMPTPVRRLYNRFSQPFLALDTGLSRLPGLNRLAGVLEIVARRA